MVPETSPAERICSIEGCGKAVSCRGWCNKHYQRWKSNGDPNKVRLIKNDDTSRFWAKVVKSDSCWRWSGHINSKTGYGLFRLGKGATTPHRYSYKIHKGEIPDGIVIDHICHNRACVNPDHLRLATLSQNQENHSGATIRSSTGVRGVSWRKRSGKYVGRVQFQGRMYSIEPTDDLNEASRAIVALRCLLMTRNDLDRKK